MVVSGLAATLFGPRLKQRGAAHGRRPRRVRHRPGVVAVGRPHGEARRRHPARCWRTWPGSTGDRSERQRQEIAIQVWARSTPSLASAACCRSGRGRCTSAGGLPSASVLIIVSTLGAARWFAWTTASLVSQLPSARVWTRRTVAMTGVAAYSAAGARRGHLGRHGTRAADRGPHAAAPPRPGRLRRRARGRHASASATSTSPSRRGELVLVVGPVGAGQVLAAAGAGRDRAPHRRSCAGTASRWTEPEHVPAPQPGRATSAQLPRVLSGTVADNIRLGHEVDAGAAVLAAQLEHDLRVLRRRQCRSVGAPLPDVSERLGEGGLALLIGHKGTRLSGGQLQRLALARALAPHTELLIADDVSSALDVVTELDLWQALRERRRHRDRLDLEARGAGPGRPGGGRSSAAGPSPRARGPSSRSAGATWPG